MLDSYTNLKLTIADWLNRADLTLQIADFIALTEASITRRVRRKTIRNTVTFTQDTLPIPIDCAELRSMRFVTGFPYRDKPIPVVTPEMLADHRAAYNNVAGRPLFASIIAGSIVIAPPPDGTYPAELTYFEKLVPLSTTNATNSVLRDSPDVYLYGALTHSAPFLKHDERIPVWQSLYEQAIGELEAAREREEFNASIRPARLPMRF